MEKRSNMPFKVGELAEARSFQIGYRGAWFRCKIREITQRKGHTGHVLEYYDFPDEKLKWTKLYQVPLHHVGKAKEKHKELMLRPQYPPIYNEKQMPHVGVISEVAVVVDDSWKVGDLVDWWTTDCYWSGRIVQLLGDDKAKIELKPPPLGEGSFYEVLLKDVRPSLDWSPEHGWSIPTQEGDAGCPSAWLIKPINQGQETEVNQGMAGSSVRLSVSSPVSSNSAVSDQVKSTGTMEIKKRSLETTFSKEGKDMQEKRMSLGCGGSGTRKTSWPDTDSRQTSAEPAAEVAEEELNSNSPPKDRASGGVALNSMWSGSLEAAILDLEEYVNKVKWLKAILRHGISSSDAPSTGPRWVFVDPNAPSEPPK